MIGSLELFYMGWCGIFSVRIGKQRFVTPFISKVWDDKFTTAFCDYTGLELLAFDSGLLA